LNDVQRLVALIASVTDPTVEDSINERRRRLLSQIAELTLADFWMWSISELTPESAGDGSACVSLYGGQVDDQELVKSAKAFMDPKQLMFANQSRAQTNLIEMTFPEQKLGSLQNGSNGSSLATTTHATRLGDSLLYFCKHEPSTVSAVGIHRRNDREAFSERDRTLFHLMIPQVTWLHKNSAEVPIDPRTMKLSLRTRQVLNLLLAGHSPKEIAAKLNLSTHTVGDYVKKIYHQFGVNSRSELHAYFHFGPLRSKSR